MPDHNAQFHSWQVDQVLRALDVDPDQGLSPHRAAERRKRYGANRIRRAAKKGVIRIWIAQFRSLVVAILSAAAFLAFAFGKTTEGIAVLAVILVNSLIGFLSEWRAARSMEALRRMGRRRVRVRRSGKESEIPSESIVPGDICLHEAGDTVSADLRLIEANALQVDESALTGESVPVAKRADPVDEDLPAADRACMLYRGTTITEGSAAGAVTAVGMDTELGRIAEMAEEAEGEDDTPLERRLNRLGSQLAWVALGACAIIGVAGLLSGRPALLMIETAIALGIAAVPEGLPFVATIALARGMWLMARRQALINRLPAVETLGTTNVILSDKTGTLTENRMKAVTLATPCAEHDLDREAQINKGGETGDQLLLRALEIGALCNNASISKKEGDGYETQGDPTEAALLAAAAGRGIERDSLLEKKPEAREVAFDPDVMMMATVHESDGRCEFAVKGAPDAVLEHCDRIAGDVSETMTREHREEWGRRAREMAGRGLRVLALADKQTDSPDDEPYEGLRFAGLVGLLDPPAEGVKKSLEDCRRAGIRVVMVTGDQPETARAIAASLGLAGEEQARVMTGADLGEVEASSEEEKKRILDTPVFARVSPEQKLRLLELFQERGNTVAMTGDGVNDAPALKKADIGVAMGGRGTDAARESSDVVLKNDAFTSILSAVEQGRVIFTNIRKSVMFMLCTNVAEVAAVGAASLLDWPLPIRPLQILFLNVITDVFPALALAAGKGNPKKAMRSPPRDGSESILGRRQWAGICAWSSVMSACVLGALMAAVHILNLPTAGAVTVSFLTLAFAKLWFVLNLRDPDSSVLRNDILGNPWLWGAEGLCAALLLAAVYMPGLSAILETRPPGLYGWITVAGLSLVPAVAGQGWAAATSGGGGKEQR